jgi:hypothetical protein
VLKVCGISLAIGLFGSITALACMQQKSQPNNTLGLTKINGGAVLDQAQLSKSPY